MKFLNFQEIDMTIVGFDFGTTNSLISIVKGDRIVNLDDGDGKPFPSVVCYEGSRVIVGQDAKERLNSSGAGVHGNVVLSPKMLLDRESLTIEGVKRSPVDIVSEIIIHIKSKVEAEGNNITTIDKAIVTIPVTMEGRRRAALRDAFRKAGISIVQFIHEPLAALYGYLRSRDGSRGLLRTDEDSQSLLRRYNRQLMLVFDWGGGTLDLTLCKMVNGSLIQVKNDGCEEVGGDRFDEALRKEIENRVRKERNISASVVTSKDAHLRLRHQAERAKIELSVKNSAKIYIPNFFEGLDDTDLQILLTREDFESIIDAIVKSGIERIRRLLMSCNYMASDVDLCLATGGMVNMPAIQMYLTEIFGVRLEVSQRSATLIAEGAALVAHDNARLNLAKDVELLMARNGRLPLLVSKTIMPIEGEIRKAIFDLYCADPRDGSAKFQLQTPIKASFPVIETDLRDNLGRILVINVDKNAKPFFERLELVVKMDDNLILHAEASSQLQKSHDKLEIHNLEFGLSLPASLNSQEDQYQSSEKKNSLENEGEEVSGLVIRSNVYNCKDEKYVPGDLMAKIDSSFSDRRTYKTPIQEAEMVYYLPCSKCRKTVNFCNCSG